MAASACMARLLRAAATIGAGLCLACGTPGAPAARSEPADRAADTRTSLPRSDVTVADRAGWREVLRWPDDCEESFARTHLTDDGGLEFRELAEGRSVVFVRCALGAYQPTTVSVLLDERPSPPAAAVLEFDTYISEDGASLVKSRAVELVGEHQWLSDTQELTVLSLARQIGDCGTWARYSFAAGRPQLEEFAARVACPGDPGARTDGLPGRPPSGWRTVPVRQ